ncbi:choice-of-anchor I family protein [Lutimaribacter marinistellae]|uniref:Choice-of-anchor I family protein n=1 Tax=Lutimaribacter marinistellae TaxID=1820329 RepID=A0ABV7TB56_9RHOB
MTYTLQILHASDLEGGVDALSRASNFAAIIEALQDDQANSVTISAGDNYIPGPFFSTAADFSMGGVLTDAYARLYTEVMGMDLTGVDLDLGRGGGRVDVSIMNVIGFDASAVGNHEFDPGTTAFSEVIGAEGGDGVIEWVGATFPYLTSNLDFGADGALSGLFTDMLMTNDMFNESLADLAAGDTGPAIAPSTIIEENGERIGVVGATTQIIETISSTGGVNETTGGVNDMAALATVIQAEIDQLIGEGVNKIIVASHLQQISLEKELAGLLNGVDVIIAGGSDTLQADATDRLRDGDTADEGYPFLATDAGGNPVAIVSTDGEYSYVGRLVVEFDENGVLMTDSIDASVSGAFATDEQGVVDMVGQVQGAQGVMTTEAQEVPPVADTAAEGSFDMYVRDNVLVVDGTFANLSSALRDVSPDGVDPEGNPIDAIHLHNAATGANGGVVRSLTVTDNGDGSGSYYGRFLLTDAELAELNAGNMYVNIHTDNNPGGELRGQLVNQTGLTDVTPTAGVAVDLSGQADIVQDLTDAVAGIVEAKDGIIFGAHEVFLDGRRESVRTEETNFGRVTAEANLAAARDADSDVMVSFKNGGGIRAAIGGSDNDGTNKGDGLLSQLDIENALRFNNGLTLITLTAEGLMMLLEHAVAETDTDAGNTPGRFPQIAGLRFSFDEAGDAQILATDDDGNYIVDPETGMPQVATEGGRVQTVALIDPETGEKMIIARDGMLTTDAPEQIRVVTLNFLVDNNGDGYPFQELATDIQYLTEDGSTTPDGDAENLLGEQKALADYFQSNFADEDNAFAEADTDAMNDRGIVQLSRNGDRDYILIGEPDDSIEVSIAATLNSGETELFTGGSEVVNTEDGKAYVTNGAQDQIDVFDMASGDLAMSIDLSGIDGYDGVQSVDVKNGFVAVAIAREGAANGVVALFDTEGSQIQLYEVGNLPDMVTFTPDGNKILVAGEGEPTDGTDPLGTVSIIDISVNPDEAVISILDFSDFDGQEDTLREEGVLIEPGKSVSEDLEPEYITVLPGGETAWVALQEANAYAVVDLMTNQITALRSFGLVDRSEEGFELDASNRDNAINLQNYDNLVGMRQPDAITSYEIDGETYVLTANEGDARDATEARVKDLMLDPTVFPNAEELQQDANLGRLKVRSDLGDTDGDGDYDQLYAYGSRSFTIYNTAGDIVFDSASSFSQIIAEIRPDQFNADDGEFDGRSDDKGVEPEAVAVGMVEGRVMAFVGLERDNGIMVMDISNPAMPQYVGYIDGQANGHLSPETIDFISPEDSATGLAQIAVAYEGDGNTVIYNFDDVTRTTGTDGADRLLGTEGDDFIFGLDGADVIDGFGGNDNIMAGETDMDLSDTVYAGAGDDTVDGGAGNDILNGMDGDDVLLGQTGSDMLVGHDGDDALSGGAISDELFGNAGDDFLNGGSGFDRLNGGAGADQFYHAGAAVHGSDWIQDYSSTDGDLLVFGLEGATADELVVNFAITEGAGDGAIAEAFIGHAPTGQTLFALVDGADATEINLRLANGDVFDLLA